MSGQQGKKWLVKIGGKILGPLTDREVAEMLRSREVRVIDEISAPCGRWIYIRDEPLFAKIVEEVRVGNLQVSEDTQTSTGSFDEVTKTPTSSITLNELDDLTEEVTQGTIQEAMYQSFDDINRGGNDRRQTAGKPTESYTFDGDKMVEAQAITSTRWVGVLTAALIFMAIGVVAFFKFISQPLQDSSFVQEKRLVAIEAMRIGDYERALENFRQAYNVDDTDRSYHTQLGVLEIQVGNQSVVGRRILEKLQNWTSAEKRRVLTGLGLAALREAEFETANKYFEDALVDDIQFLPALINLGVTALYLKDYEKADSHFQLALKDGSRDGLDLLLLTETLISLHQKTRDRSYLIEAKRYLDGMRKVRLPYLDEVLVASARIEVMLGNKAKAQSHMVSFLERPLGMTKLFRHDILVHRDQVDWVKMNQWCLETTRNLDPSAHIIAAEAKCLYMSGDIIAASRKIDDAVSQKPKDPLVQAAYSELLSGMNSKEKAKVARDKAMDFNKESDYVLPTILQARYCEEQRDYFCALNYWLEVLEKLPNSEIALAGVGRSYFEDGHYSDARKYLGLAKRQRTNFKPVLQLDKDLSQVDSERGF